MGADRRRFLGAAAGLALAGCQPWSEKPWVRELSGVAEKMNRHAQRALLSRSTLAPEFSEAELSPRFRVNGSSEPDDAGYRAHARRGFADWRLPVGGLVARPLELSLAELRTLPARTRARSTTRASTGSMLFTRRRSSPMA